MSTLKRTGGGFALQAKPVQAKPVLLALFDPACRAARTIPYWLDRDDSAYTPVALSRRERLRFHPGVVAGVRAFTQQVYALDSDGLVQKDEYFRVHAKIVRILIGDVLDADLERILGEDWEADSQGADALDGGQVFNSLFELADIWCPAISAAQYVSFLEILGGKLVATGRGAAAASKAATKLKGPAKAAKARPRPLSVMRQAVA